MAGRNNPLIIWLNVSFDTFNLIHRWLGRIVILEAITHTLAFWIGSASNKGWDGALQTTFNVRYMTWGFIVSAIYIYSRDETQLIQMTGDSSICRDWDPSHEPCSARGL